MNITRAKTNAFTAKYHAYWLLYFESSKYINNIIAREKEIKGWTRAKKETLITSFNPEWKFLNEELFGKWPPEELTKRLLISNGYT